MKCIGSNLGECKNKMDRVGIMKMCWVWPKAGVKNKENDRMTPHFDHFHYHLTWQQNLHLNFFLLTEKLNWQKGTWFSAHARVLTAFSKFPQHHQTAHLFFLFSKLLTLLCAPSSSRTHTDPHHTHLFSTFPHRSPPLLHSPQNPSQRETLTLSLSRSRSVSHQRNHFAFFENDCPVPLHRSISLPRTTQTRNRHPSEPQTLLELFGIYRATQ